VLKKDRDKTLKRKIYTKEKVEEREREGEHVVTSSSVILLLFKKMIFFAKWRLSFLQKLLITLTNNNNANNPSKLSAKYFSTLSRTL
jgi:hypothetical protein